MPFHVLAVAESDSYLKWAVSLLATLPEGVTTDVTVACSPIRPSPSQLENALSGTAWAGRDLDVLTPAQLLRRVDRDRPDAVLIACAGPSVHAYSEAISRSPHRPVLVAGIPGIALPARRKAWDFRGAIDLMVVHSRREVAEYELVRLLTGKTGRVGLATVPFLRGGPRPDLSEGGPHDHPDHPEQGIPQVAPGRDRVLFATQAKMPKERDERDAVLVSLDRLAAARPDLRVVVKTRGEPGEFHTHYEPHHYAELWQELVEAGRVTSGRVEFASGPMAAQLDQAAALVTVSSTAVLEAMARDVPVLLLDEFGVTERLLNKVFEDSGCLGGLAALEKADFRRPERLWLADNYFHPERENTWIALLEELVLRARSGGLPPLAAGLNAERSRGRRRRDRMRLTPAGSSLARTRQRIRMRRQQRRVDALPLDRAEVGGAPVGQNVIASSPGVDHSHKGAT